jgi:hypothetical protein
MKIPQWLRPFLAPLAFCIGVGLLIVLGVQYTAIRDDSVLIDCAPYLNDPMMDAPFGETTQATLQSWVESAYGNFENWSDRQWPDGTSTVGWTASLGQYRADFTDNGSELLDISKILGRENELSGQQVIQCFGEPAFYQAFYQQEPHHIALIIELIYPEHGLILRSYDLSNWFGRPQPSSRASFKYMSGFPPIEANRDAIAPYIARLWYLEEWDDEGWAQIAVHEWNGWDDIQVITDETIAAGSPRAPAIATAIAANFLTAPPFPILDDPTSPTCRAVISPSLYNLQYGEATMEETHQLLRGLYQHLYGASEHRIEPSSASDDTRTWPVLRWDVHPSELSEHDYYYTANFEDNILKNAESTVYGTSLAEYFSCFGDPSDTILTINDTPNGRLQALYLFFPGQGIVTGTYLFDDEIEPPHENFPVMMAYQTSPQPNSVALLQAAFSFSDNSTYREWEENLQMWHGFEYVTPVE